MLMLNQSLVWSCHSLQCVIHFPQCFSLIRNGIIFVSALCFCPNFFNNRTTRLHNSVFEILHPFKKWSLVSFLKGVYYPATFQDFTEGHRYRVSLYHYFAAQLSNFNWGFTERWSCSLHSCSTHQSRTLQSTCSKLGSPEYFLLAWRRGRAQHTTMNNQNSWEMLCWATNLALKWELTNLLHQAKSMELLPAQQSPLYGTQINSFPIVHLSLPSIMRSGWLSRHPIVLVQSLNSWIKNNNNKKIQLFHWFFLCLYIISVSNRNVIVSGIYNKFNMI